MIQKSREELKAEVETHGVTPVLQAHHPSGGGIKYLFLPGKAMGMVSFFLLQIETLAAAREKGR